MGGRYFNWKFGIVLLLGFGIVAGTVVGLHYVQQSGRSQEYYDKGMKSFEQGQWQEAAEFLGKRIAYAGSDPNTEIDVLRKYAQAQLKIKPSRSNNIQQAIGAFREILQIDSGDRTAAKQLVEIYLQIGAIGEARLVAQRFLEGQRDVDVERLLAEALIFQREFDEAYKMLQTVVEEEPNQIAAYEKLAAITVERPDDFEHASAYWLDLAIEKNPESALAYLTRARFGLMHQDRAQAKNDLDMALTKKLSDPEEHMVAAVLYRVLGRMESAHEHLDALQKLQPDHLAMWIFRAGLALASQDKDEMCQVADDSQANLKDKKWGFNALAAELYVRAHAFDKAQNVLDSLKEHDSQPADVAFLEGLLAIQQDRVQEAVQKWQRALALGYQSPSPNIQLYLGFRPTPLKFLLSSAHEQLGDTMSARQMLNSLASDNTDDRLVQLSLARHMARVGDWQQARSHTQNVLRTDPNNKEASLLNLEANIKLLSRETRSATASQRQSIEQRLEEMSADGEQAVNVSLLKFQMALSQKDYNAAKTVLEQISTNDPQDLEKVTVAWVNLLLAQDQKSEIIERLKTAVREHGQSVQMVGALAYSLEKDDDYDAAEQVLMDAMARMNSRSNRLSIGYLLSDSLTRWYKEDEKVALLEKLNQQCPDTVAVLRRLLQCKTVVETPEKAQALVNQIQAIEGEQGWQWRYEQARLWFGQSDFQTKYSEAVSLLQQNLRGNGSDLSSRRMLAAIHSKAGQSSLALATYRDALSLAPYDLSIVIPTVKALQDAKEFEEADDILKRVASRDLTDPYLDRLQVNSYLQQGNVTSAAALMESYLQDDPNNVSIALALARLKIGQKEYDGGKAMLDKIKESTHDAATIFAVEQLEVQVLLQQGLSDQALQLCNSLVDAYKDADSLKLRYNVKVLLGQINEAIEDLDKAIEYNQNDANLWAEKSRLYWSQQKKMNAMDAMDKALLLAPNDPNIVVQVTDLFIATQEADRLLTAKALLEQVSEQHPDDHRLKTQKVRLILMEGDAASQIQAEVLLEQLTIDHPKEASVWLMLGELLMGRKDWAKAQNVAIRGLTQLKENFALLGLKARAEAQISPSFAVQTLEAMLEQSPGHVGVALELASARIRTKKPQKAIEVLNAHKTLITSEAELRLYEFAMLSALYEADSATTANDLLVQLKQKYPDDQRTVMVPIPISIREGNYAGVKQEVTQWLEANPENTTPLEYAVTVLGSLSGTEAKTALVDLLTAALKKQPESEAILMLFAQTQHAQGLFKDAAQLYEKALQANSSNAIAMNNVAWIYGHNLNQIDKGLQMAKKGLESMPRYTDLLDTYGTLSYMAGQYDEAIKSLKECLDRPSYKKATSAAATMYTLAQSYLANGDRSNARLMFRQCLDRNRQLNSSGLSRDQQREANKQLATLMGIQE